MRSRSKPLVLSVDDDPTIQNLIRRYVSDSEVVCASSCSEGLAAVEEHQPDLILMDVQMPVMDGFEFCAMLQQNPESAKIPVIFLSALGDAQDKARAMAVGAVDYLTKPFSKMQLVNMITLHLKKKS